MESDQEKTDGERNPRGAFGAGAGEIVWLEDLDLTHMLQGWGEARARMSVCEKPLRIGGREFEHGVGTHARSEIRVELKGCARRFTAWVGVDEEVGAEGAVRFEVWADYELKHRTETLRGGMAPVAIDVDLNDAGHVVLVVEKTLYSTGSDHADWADAKFIQKPGATERPESIGHMEEPVTIAMTDPPEPAIHGPRVVGTTPGKPFLFLIPATGDGPLVYSADHLPEGLALDPATGIIAGRIESPGETNVMLRVSGPKGEAARALRIVAGDGQLALTPPMGWNSWNCWGCSVDDKKVRAAADWMVKSGLAAHGFQYINIDDAWEGDRDADGELHPNKKFPDLKALADYVHSKGLKLGIYSSPGNKTCGGFEGSYNHEQQDADAYARWGIDYLKYDYCSYLAMFPSRDIETYKKPYAIMGEALKRCGRDIVYSLCWGGGETWRWWNDVGGNLWRTSDDILDFWGSMSGIGFSQDELATHAGPGHWNDPDMLVVGRVGWGANTRQTRLTPSEQVTHITLWSLLAAPLLIGCDLSQLDDFTRAILSNPEVIDVDQDPLGIQARRRHRDDAHNTEVWSRPLFDGTIAVGLFNRGFCPMEITARWSDIGVKEKQSVRDLWRRMELGEFEEEFTARVPAHGAVLVKVGAPKRA